MRRFWEKVDASGDCWEWTAAKNLQGYGKMKLPGGFHQAHRLSYELLVGPIPDGLVIDHLCRNRACVNPNHLEPVTHRVNILRGTGATASNARKTHCPQGHEYDDKNTWIRQGRRRCRTCYPPPTHPPPADRTHCINGHEFDDENTYIRKNGNRACRECRRESKRRYRERRDDAG